MSALTDLTLAEARDRLAAREVSAMGLDNPETGV